MDKVIKFSPTLPCCTIDGEQLCNKPARVGVCYPAAGGWMLQPVCPSCVLAVSKVYKIVLWDDELKPEGEQPNE